MATAAVAVALVAEGDEAAVRPAMLLLPVRSWREEGVLDEGEDIVICFTKSLEFNKCREQFEHGQTCRA